jgi:hypothetical protein
LPSIGAYRQPDRNFINVVSVTFWSPCMICFQSSGTDSLRNRRSWRSV